jgi:hypothetical protein
MTPDLLAEFEAAMSDLEDLVAAIDQHGPGYLRACLETSSLRQSPRRPPELPATIARAIREVADDALVRAAARRPLIPRQHSIRRAA